MKGFIGSGYFNMGLEQIASFKELKAIE